MPYVLVRQGKINKTLDRGIKMLKSETLFIVYHGSIDVRLHRDLPESAPTVCTVIVLQTCGGRVIDAKRGLLNRTGLVLDEWHTPDWRISSILGDVRAQREQFTDDYVILNGSHCPLEKSEI